MSGAHWSEEDGLVSVPAAASLQPLVDEAAGLERHLGMRSALYSTVEDALAEADPVLCQRLVRARVQGPTGDVLGPLAPRAAVGPDVTCFAVGTHSLVGSVTLRADHVVAWGAQESCTLDESIALARRLTERGCTLVEVEARAAGSCALVAAFPRRSLASLLPSTRPFPRVTARAVLSFRVTWPDAAELWRALSSDVQMVGSLTLSALNPDFAAVQVVHPEGRAALSEDARRSVELRYRPAASWPHPDVMKALSLRSTPARPARA
ncbi:MAG: hypothetical protein AB2A00_25790 [Myxococcota bacterium]